MAARGQELDETRKQSGGKPVEGAGSCGTAPPASGTAPVVAPQSPSRRSHRPTANTDTNCSLFVGDLSPRTTEVRLLCVCRLGCGVGCVHCCLAVTQTDLFSLFGQTARVTSIRLCRDQATQQPLGHAYVNFQTHEDGTMAATMAAALSALWFAAHSFPVTQLHTPWRYMQMQPSTARLAGLHGWNATRSRGRRGLGTST